MVKVSRYPIEELTAFNDRMGWTVPYVSSLGSDFNYDFGVAFTKDETEGGMPTMNMHRNWDHSDTPGDRYPDYEGIPRADEPPVDGQGVSAFAADGDAVYHTYSAYARGGDVLWGMYQWLDRAPLGRNESSRWYKLHDEYKPADRNA